MPRSATATKESKDVKKQLPKPPPSHADQLKRQFGSLCAQIDGSHFKNAIKTCDRILRIAPGDPDALKTKLFLLLQTEQYARAVELISTIPGTAYAYQQAYALYRLNREAETADLIQSIKSAVDSEYGRGILHLEAQLQYRRGDYAAAVESYTHLLDTCPSKSEEHSDVVTNLNASQTHLDFLTRGFLTSLQKLPTTLTHSLESAPPPTLAPSHIPQILPSAPRMSPAVGATVRPKPPRPSRVPKGVVPGVTPLPDPERWIKKSERTAMPSHAHAKKKKGAVVTGAAGTTQGSTAVAVPVVVPTGSHKSAGKKKK